MEGAVLKTALLATDGLIPVHPGNPLPVPTVEQIELGSLHFNPLLINVNICSLRFVALEAREGRVKPGWYSWDAPRYSTIPSLLFHCCCSTSTSTSPSIFQANTVPLLLLQDPHQPKHIYICLHGFSDEHCPVTGALLAWQPRVLEGSRREYRETYWTYRYSYCKYLGTERYTRHPGTATVYTWVQRDILDIQVQLL